MAFKDLTKGQSSKINIAMTVVALTPVVLPLLVRAAKPVARAVLKAGVIVYERGREALAEGREMVHDVVAEVRAELAAKHAAQAGELVDNSDDAGVKPASSAVDPSQKAAAGAAGELKKTA